jgi:hypothetical protein
LPERVEVTAVLDASTGSDESSVTPQQIAKLVGGTVVTGS